MQKPYTLTLTVYLDDKQKITKCKVDKNPTPALHPEWKSLLEDSLKSSKRRSEVF